MKIIPLIATYLLILMFFKWGYSRDIIDTLRISAEAVFLAMILGATLTWWAHWSDK